ncbi:MAG: ParA family protein [Candidatus Methanosuratincola sp.]|nr:ParA family protein [Candidatus Methanosuratincola sp.]
MLKYGSATLEGEMARIIVFVNQKGGVGKTTSAINIGATLALHHKKTLLIDFDPQGNLTSGIGGKLTHNNIYHVISGLTDIKSVIQPLPVPRLFLAPSSVDLSGATIELVDKPDRNDYLRRAIAPVLDEYEFILIDCPPSLGILTLNGLAAATEVIIPLQCEYFALEGLSLIIQTIGLVQKSINPNLKIGGILLTMFDVRNRLSHRVVEEVRGHFGNKVFKTVIPRNVRISESPSHGLPIILYDVKSRGAVAYMDLAHEILYNGRA